MFQVVRGGMRRTRDKSSNLATRHSRRNGYASSAHRTARPVRRNGYAAETGTQAGSNRPKRPVAESGTLQGKIHAEMGTLLRRRSDPRCSRPRRTVSFPCNKVPINWHFPLRPQKQVRSRHCSLWKSLCILPLIPAETGSGGALKRVRLCADSGSAVRRIEFGTPQIRVRRGVNSALESAGWRHVYGLRVVNPYRYRLLVDEHRDPVDNPCGLPTASPGCHQSGEGGTKTQLAAGNCRKACFVPVSA